MNTTSVLQAWATQRAATRPVWQLPLADFVPRVSPMLEPPRHLEALCRAFDRIRAGEEVRLLVSVPPQHGKTFCILHGLAQLIAARPDKTNAFASYGSDYAHSRSRLCRDYARTAGVKLRGDSAAMAEWRTEAGGGLLATGVGGPLTGHGISGVLVVDDPYKNREEADSALVRGKIRDWWTSAALTRVHPGASIIVCHTRWHPDDLIGELEKQREQGWEVMNLPALDDAERPLWHKRPKAFLDKVRRDVGEHDWWALYMGSPRPRGGALFSGVSFYDKLPETYRVSIGIDLAYSESTYSDYSVAVVMAHSAQADAWYVLDVRRMQAKATDFAATLRELVALYPGAKLYGYVGGTEKGTVDFLRREGIPFRPDPARLDKLSRATSTAAAWTSQRVHVPRQAAWLRDFVDEVCSFTGIKDRHDDQVDALVAAFDALHTKAYRTTGFSDGAFDWG
jgi:predicted phage terminase large subunit-like protein